MNCITSGCARVRAVPCVLQRSVDNAAVLIQLCKRPVVNGVGPIYGHIGTVTSALSSLPARVLQQLRGLMQQMHITLIAGILH